MGADPLRLARLPERRETVVVYRTKGCYERGERGFYFLTEAEGRKFSLYGPEDEWPSNILEAVEFMRGRGYDVIFPEGECCVLKDCGKPDVGKRVLYPIHERDAAMLRRAIDRGIV